MDTKNTSEVPLQLQLSLDFTPKTKRVLRTPKAPWVVRHSVAEKPSPAITPVPAIQNNAPVFHAEASSISGNQYALKFSVHGRSYLVRGVYRTISERSRSDSEIYTVIGNIRIDELFAYRNGNYTPVPVTRQEYVRFENLISSVLRNPYYNDTLVAS